jgi:aspartyl-tRNA(Asn)/glutamyl-tRNA(Gln) amidotransferase subunit C
MPLLTLTEVEHIAELARLNLTPEEKERFRVQLSAILEYAARLQVVDTTGIPPTASVLPGAAGLRADEPRQGLSTEETLKNAPDAHHNQFRVPPVLDREAPDA